ncbi:HNH endonuclease [Leptolyngbya sp. AN02str]|uniref:HNH endonuclease n=1 Tax=Leptolyngbya sp. AN02str TaxID=3423363 RepID=UPI003D314084
MKKDLDYYARKFAKLNVNRKKGINAPHKPVLLLAVTELIEQKKIQTNQIYLSPELIATFLKYWSNLVITHHQAKIALPFFHLTGDKFWHLAPIMSYEGNLASIKPGLSVLRNAVRYAYTDPELFELLQSPITRLQFANILMQTWFPHQEIQLQKLYEVDEFENIQRQLSEQGGAVYQVEDLKDEEEMFIRNAAFRRVVVSLYEQRCVFCKLKVISQDNQNIVDGAHIKPFAEFRDDRFDNGISLCKNHHWAFDHGWFGIDDSYRIVVPDERFYEETLADTKPIRDFHGERILMPTQLNYQPRLEALRWHCNYWNRHSAGCSGN